MSQEKLVDHLFRHQYGKMVAILTRIFGLTHLQMIEDAVQDTFILAVQKWKTRQPDHPEAWLMAAAKNRVIDLLRKIKADQTRLNKLVNGPSAMVLNDLFLDHEIEDSQLRMIFTACHPTLKPIEQIAFALKTISGFSIKEIASALLQKEETVKKRLSRARKSIKQNNIKFSLPEKEEIPVRMKRVLEVIYLIFNEGFHSGKKELLVRKDLCGEALRLCKMILKKPNFRSGASYGLFGLICLHTARLESKTNDKNEIIDLENQDRSKWFQPLITLGDNALTKSFEYDDISTFQIEAAIASVHLNAPTFDATDWKTILIHYKNLNKLHQTPFTLLGMAIVHLQLQQFDQAYDLLQKVTPSSLEQRSYLYFGAMADYYKKNQNKDKALEYYQQALAAVNNEAEKKFLLKKIDQL